MGILEVTRESDVQEIFIDLSLVCTKLAAYPRDVHERALQAIVRVLARERANRRYPAPSIIWMSVDQEDGFTINFHFFSDRFMVVDINTGMAPLTEKREAFVVLRGTSLATFRVPVVDDRRTTSVSFPAEKNPSTVQDFFTKASKIPETVAIDAGRRLVSASLWEGDAAAITTASADRRNVAVIDNGPGAYRFISALQGLLTSLIVGVLRDARRRHGAALSRTADQAEGQDVGQNSGGFPASAIEACGRGLHDLLIEDVGSDTQGSGSARGAPPALAAGVGSDLLRLTKESSALLVASSGPSTIGEEDAEPNV